MYKEPPKPKGRITEKLYSHVGKIPISIQVIAAADELMTVDQSPRADILASYQDM